MLIYMLALELIIVIWNRMRPRERFCRINKHWEVIVLEQNRSESPTWHARNTGYTNATKETSSKKDVPYQWHIYIPSIPRTLCDMGVLHRPTTQPIFIQDQTLSNLTTTHYKEFKKSQLYLSHTFPMLLYVHESNWRLSKLVWTGRT